MDKAQTGTWGLDLSGYQAVMPEDDAGELLADENP
jgi:hypothetical protein